MKEKNKNKIRFKQSSMINFNILKENNYKGRKLEEYFARLRFIRGRYLTNVRIIDVIHMNHTASNP